MSGGLSMTSRIGLLAVAPGATASAMKMDVQSKSPRRIACLPFRDGRSPATVQRDHPPLCRL